MDLQNGFILCTLKSKMSTWFVNQGPKNEIIKIDNRTSDFSICDKKVQQGVICG